MATSRITVKSPYGLENRRKGARYLAKKSDIRLLEPAVASRMQKLQKLVKSERQCKLQLGDVLVDLIDRYELRPVDLARELKERANHLSEMYHVSRMFPRKVRQLHIPYSHYWATMRVVRKFKMLKLNPLKTLQEIASLGLTQHRQITAHYADKLRRAESQTAQKRMKHLPASGWVNKCHHADFRDMESVIPDQSVKILHVDPPYANYRRVADGRYSAGSITRLDCDNETAAEAIQLTVDLLRDWGAKLTTGGVLLLWQAAGPLRMPIATAIEQYAWEVEAVAIWDKSVPQPANFSTPYSSQTEWLWIIKRAGESLVNHDNSSRSDILRFKPIHHIADLHERSHAFEKPLDLCKFLVNKHSHPNEIVVDLCACTGSMSAAAAELGRQWVYVESHADNFAVGEERMARIRRKSMRIAS